MKLDKVSKFIFITGGVVSSLGKGLASASLGALLQARGYKICLRKLDPYLNVDPGTMSPTQHGEVFVTEDGAETDLDLGHYERFTGIDAKKGDNVTTGQIYSTLLKKERRGDYLGKTVQVIPHVTDLIKEFILNDSQNYDFILCEIGGTVGDIEGLPFFEAIRQIGYEHGPNKVCFTHLTLLPYLPAAKELKTKPTQHSVKELRSIGIQPDILICRVDREIPEAERKKIALFCNLQEDRVIPCLDVKTIYEVPLSLYQHGLDKQVLAHFGIDDSKEPDLSIWENIVANVKNATETVKVAIVGKYVKLDDAYKSLLEALTHAAIANASKLVIKWINSRNLSEKNIADKLADCDAVLIPGGFGLDGTEGKMLASNYARKNKIPTLAICYGMQLTVIDIARNECGIENASSSEFLENPSSNTEDSSYIIDLMTEWKKGSITEKRSKSSNYGGTMRLGSYECHIKPNTKTYEIYGCKEIFERHRHRYEINIKFQNQLEKHGVIFSGMSPDGKLPEIIEIKDHPWFIAVQFHPELKSRPFAPHPLFCSFIEHAIKYKNK